jgi:hypothetical protein
VVVHHHHEARVERHSFGKGDEGHHGGDDELGRDFVKAMSGRTSSRASLAIGLESARLCLRARDAARATTSH